MEKIKNYIIGILGLIIFVLFCILLGTNSCNKEVKHINNDTISNTLDTTNIKVNENKDTIYLEKYKYITLYKDKEVLKDTNLTSYNSTIDKDSICINSYTKVKGKLASLDLEYFIKYPLIEDRIDSTITIVNTITKLRVDTVKIKQSLLYIGIQGIYNPLTLKADIGPTILLNLSKFKIGYSFNLVSKNHQGSILIPLRLGK